MRTSTITTAIFISSSTALRLPQFDFLSALPIALQDYIPTSISNQTAHEVLRRQNSNACPENFNSCSNLGAPGLCCAPNAVCSADFAGYVACCPSGAACSGTIGGGPITTGTVDSDGAIVGGAGATTGTDDGLTGTTATATTDFDAASSTSGGGLVAASTDDSNNASTDDGNNLVTSSNGFIVAASTTVATPGAGVRRAEIVSTSLGIC